MPAHIETWRLTHDPDYEVSDLGRVRSWKTGSPQILRPAANRKGYLHLDISGSHCYVHRLVAVAFLGPCPPDCEVMHGDHSPANNSVDNLRYGTASQNNIASVLSGRRRQKLDVVTIRMIRASTDPHKTLASQLGVSSTLIRSVRARRAWAHVA